MNITCLTLAGCEPSMAPQRLLNPSVRGMPARTAGAAPSVVATVRKNARSRREPAIIGLSPSAGGKPSAAGESRYREAANRRVEYLGDVRLRDGLAAVGCQGGGDLQAAAGVGGHDQARAGRPDRGRLPHPEFGRRLRLQ